MPSACKASSELGNQPSRHGSPGVRLARLPGVALLALIQHVRDVAEAVDERVQDSLPLLC